MGLLDRFRSQPRWKHSNPAVRIAAVEELPLDQQDVLLSVAREDRDTAVRLAALRKIISPVAIAGIARDDADARVREEGASLLFDLATGAVEGSEADCLAALEGLSDPRQVVAVAKTASSEAVARAALDRVQDPAAVGSVARRSVHPPVRLEALARVVDPREVLAVALRSEFKDVSLAAVERLGSDRGALEDVASHARNKSAAKRARALARAIDESASRAAVPAAPEPAAGQEEEEKARRRAALAACERLEAVAAEAMEDGEAAVGEIERSWRLAGGEEMADLAPRFAAARAAAAEALERSRQERSARAAALQAMAEAVAVRRSLCEQLDAVAGEETEPRLEEARRAWAALPELGDAGEAERWRERLEEACRAAEARHRAAIEHRERREKAAVICDQVASLAETAAFPQGRAEWQALRRSWNALTAAGFEDQALFARFAEADERLRSKEAEERQRRAQEQQENLARYQKLCADLEAVPASPSLTLKAADRAIRQARAALEEEKSLPSRQDHDEVTRRLKAVIAALVPRAQELRDMDEWQRWANAGVQEELCRQVEALVQEEDLAVAARQLREAQARWKQVATAPRDRSQALWNRFKAACDAVRARCDVYYATRAEEQAASQARKQALCEQAEALSGSSDWVRTAEGIQKLQAEWKTIGPAPRDAEKALWDRFHAACDAFFTRRRDDLRQRKGEWAANLAKKEALCARAEELAETTEWASAIDEIKRLQAEWKTIGPVRKAKAEQLWRRFRAACDRFFDRYQHRDQAALAAAEAELEALAAEFESMPPAEGAAADPPEGLAERVAAARRQWTSKLSALPRDRAARLGDRWSRALERVAEAWPSAFAGTDLDLEANVRAMEELCVQIESLSADAPRPAFAAAIEAGEGSPATLLAQQLREALATNTIAGRPDEAARAKAVSEQVRQAQAAWRRIGPVPEAAGRALAARFQRAVQRVHEQRRSSARP
ncbi:MAG TPA: DUF349 domain-containing protein [Vicinamibacterales bacterium]|nr:DUF349 domain-containing protein [Vicinamibacterales bacterium]